MGRQATARNAEHKPRAIEREALRTPQEHGPRPAPRACWICSAPGNRAVSLAVREQASLSPQAREMPDSPGELSAKPMEQRDACDPRRPVWLRAAQESGRHQLCRGRQVVTAKAPSATAKQGVEAAVTAWLKKNERVPPRFTWRIIYVSN
jgi:hypothetical protein